jgi:glutamate 5-kinase
MEKNQYPLSELIKRWEREELTVEQAVGQILLWVKDLSKRVRQIEQVRPEQSGPELG